MEQENKDAGREAFKLRQASGKEARGSTSLGEEEQSLNAFGEEFDKKDIRGNYGIRKHLRVLLIFGMYLGGVAFAILCGRYIYGIWDNNDKVLSLLREAIGVAIGLVIGQRLPQIFPSTISHQKPQQ